MELTNNTTTTTITTTTSPENQETPTTQIQKPKNISHSNGVLKRRNPSHSSYSHHHHYHPVVVFYKECLKNHAAGIGGHAVDGCGEFMPAPTANPAEPTSLKCAACGCHRNFHRREPDEPVLALEYLPHHRHHPPPPSSTAARVDHHLPLPLSSAARGDHPLPLSTAAREDHHRSPHSSSPPSPPPISSAYYPTSAVPHMLLALSSGFPGEKSPLSAQPATNSGCRKRFRTKFTSDQKEKMLGFAERIGWKLQRKDEDMVKDFCRGIGIEKGVLKVWMHNNKNTHPRATVGNPRAAVNGGVNNGNGYGFCIESSRNNSNSTDSEFHLHHESSNEENKKDNSSSS